MLATASALRDTAVIHYLEDNFKPYVSLITVLAVRGSLQCRIDKLTNNGGRFKMSIFLATDRSLTREDRL